nr:HAD hydrolase-like protein [Maliibacterium massiliense]
MARLFDAVIWDWNGTLLDDVDFCLRLINTLLARRNLPALTLARYREVFDFPIETYYARIGFDLEKEPFDVLAEEYMHCYQAPSLTEARVHEQTRSALIRVRALGLHQSLLSASQRGYLLEQVDAFALRGAFDDIYGIDDIYSASKVHLAQRWLEGNAFAPQRVLFVGDSLHDVETARSIRSACALVACGHQSRARLEKTGLPVFDAPADVVAALARGDARLARATVK